MEPAGLSSHPASSGFGQGFRLGSAECQSGRQSPVQGSCSESSRPDFISCPGPLAPIPHLV